MPDSEIYLRVPPRCIRCSATDTVKLQQTIKGDHIALEWVCTVCNAEWPVKRGDEQSRSAPHNTT